MNSIELLLEEYKIVANIGEKYFDRMYATINFTVVFYGAILTIMYGTGKSVPSELIFAYLLPTGTYILGLFYAYNSFSITRQGYHMIMIENLIITYSTYEYKKKSFIGWNICAKTKGYNGGYILPYGTSLIFFLIAPFFDLMVNLYLKEFNFMSVYVENKGINLAISIFPLCCYACYLVFMVIIITNIIKLHSEIKKIQIYSIGYKMQQK